MIRDNANTLMRMIHLDQQKVMSILIGGITISHYVFRNTFEEIAPSSFREA